jgi:type IV pilus assembly protein PilO
VEQINKYRSGIILGLLALFLILFAFYMIAIQPVNHELSAQTLQLSQLEQEKARIENKLNELTGAGDGASLDQDRALAAIPQGDDSEGLILDLGRIGSSSHARLKDIGFTLADTNGIGTWTGLAAASTDGIREIKMTAIVDGGYAEIHEWLKQLHALPRLITVDSFALQQPYELRTPQMPGSILSASISFTAYYETAAPAQQ